MIIASQYVRNCNTAAVFYLPVAQQLRCSWFDVSLPAVRLTTKRSTGEESRRGILGKKYTKLYIVQYDVCVETYRGDHFGVTSVSFAAEGLQPNLQIARRYWGSFSAIDGGRAFGGHAWIMVGMNSQRQS